MKVEAQPRDTEQLVRALMADLLSGEDCTVGIGVPAGWTPASSPPHLEVAWDGTPLMVWPIVTHATVRLVARAASTSAAKALCGLAFGRLCAYNGDEAIAGTRPLTGPQPARDPETGAELAAATVRVSVLTEPIDADLLAMSWESGESIDWESGEPIDWET